jgi:hypothetical protein
VKTSEQPKPITDQQRIKKRSPFATFGDTPIQTRFANKEGKKTGRQCPGFNKEIQPSQPSRSSRDTLSGK